MSSAQSCNSCRSRFLWSSKRSANYWGNSWRTSQKLLVGPLRI